MLMTVDMYASYFGSFYSIMIEVDFNLRTSGGIKFLQSMCMNRFNWNLN